MAGQNRIETEAIAAILPGWKKHKVVGEIRVLLDEDLSMKENRNSAGLAFANAPD